MPRVLLSRIAVALIAGLPMLLAIWLCQTRVIAAADEPAGARSAIESLPGLAAEAPLVSAEPLSQSAMDRARALNAAIPFHTGPLSPAPPFRMTSSPVDFARARECLALAAMAEAGPSDIGQRAVVQVILNRVRHPAFAKTVCGVVFEGSQRATGCQFSFTCDGSLARQYSPAAWAAARGRADAALTGAVFPAVGNATHYHTDWVHPYWSPKLVKLARIETHLFFRWPGYWGSAAASRVPYHGGEPDMASLETQPAEALPSAAATFAPLPADTPKVTGGQVAMRVPSGKGNFLLLGRPDAAQALANARKLCGATGTCRVMGWSDPAAIPAAFPLTPAARAALQFSYSRDPAGAEIVLYACDWFKDAPGGQCIPKAR